MGNFLRFIRAAVANIVTRVLLLLSGDERLGKKKPPEELQEAVPPLLSAREVREGEVPCCCDAAVFVGDIHFFGIPVIAWRNVGREIASDLEDLGFKVTLNTAAHRDDVYGALANPNLKMLVVIGHGEKDDTTSLVYMAGDDPTGLNFVGDTGIAAAIQQAHNGPHPCLQKVILESCFAGKPQKMTKWQAAFGLGADSITAPTGRTNGIAQYYYYLFKQDYGVKADVCPVVEPNLESSVAPITGSTVTNPNLNR